MRGAGLSLALAAAGLCLLNACTSTKQIRVENASTRQISNLSIAGQAYGDLAPGETSEYKDVKLRMRYASLRLHVDGKHVTAQALNFGARRFTYRIDVKDFDAGHLKIDLVREKGSSDSAGRRDHGD